MNGFLLLSDESTLRSDFFHLANLLFRILKTPLNYLPKKYYLCDVLEVYLLVSYTYLQVYKVFPYFDFQNADYYFQNRVSTLKKLGSGPAKS